MTKQCGMCFKIKPLSEFHRRTKSPDGLALMCKPCKADYAKRLRGDKKLGTGVSSTKSNPLGSTEMHVRRGLASYWVYDPKTGAFHNPVDYL